MRICLLYRISSFLVVALRVSASSRTSVRSSASPLARLEEFLNCDAYMPIVSHFKFPRCCASGFGLVTYQCTLLSLTTRAPRGILELRCVYAYCIAFQVSSLLRFGFRPRHVPVYAPQPHHSRA